MTEPRRLDRSRLRFGALQGRRNRVLIERDRVLPRDPPGVVSEQARGKILTAAQAIRAARAAGRPVILAFGAHAIKNGLSPVLQHLIGARLVDSPGHQRRRGHS